MKKGIGAVSVLAGLTAIYVLSKKKNSVPSLPSSGQQYAKPIGPELPRADEESVGSLVSGLFASVTSSIGNLLGTNQKSFIAKITPIAETIYHKYGVHPLITITQAAHESGWGASGLTAKANNLYGYTGDRALKDWLKSKGLSENLDMNQIRAMDQSAAPFIILQTKEEVSGTPSLFNRPGDIVNVVGNIATVYRPFRRYDSWASSVEDWVQLMRGARYAKAWAAALAGDMDAFASEVYAAGYATDSAYPTKLVALAHRIEDIGTA